MRIPYARRPDSILFIFVLALAAALPLTGSSAFAQEPPPTCPAKLSAWVVSGGFGDGDEWSARFLTIQGDRARLEEVRVRSEVPKISEDDAKWFATADRPKPEPVDVSVAQKILVGDPLKAICREISEAGIAVIQARSRIDQKRKPNGQVEEQWIESLVVDTRGGVRVGVHAPPVPPTKEMREAEVKEAVAEKRSLEQTQSFAIDEEDLSDGAESDEEPGAPKKPATDAGKSKERSRAVIAAIRSVIERNSRSLVASPNSFASMPAARRILRSLSAIDEDAISDAVPSDFLFEVATAPRDVEVPLCAEALARDDEDDLNKLSALRRLGNQPSPTAVDDLVVVLQDPASDKTKQDMAILALRALLKADPAQARIAAARLLTGARPVARAAFGVFAETEQTFAQEIRTLDFKDNAKVLALTTRLKRHLADDASDPALRRAAGGA